MSRTKIEIYLSETSPRDLELLSLWNSLTQEGRGRAQSVFRNRLFSLLDEISTEERKVRDITKKNKKPGRPSTWHPNQDEKERLPGERGASSVQTDMKVPDSIEGNDTWASPTTQNPTESTTSQKEMMSSIPSKESPTTSQEASSTETMMDGMPQKKISRVKGLM